MSRTVIAAVVAAVIVALTGFAYALISSSIEDKAQRDGQSRVLRARQMLDQTIQLDVVSTLSKVERLAADEGFLRGLRTAGVDRANATKLAFERFAAKESRDRAADIIALVDEGGNVIAMSGVSAVVERLWKDDKGELRWPAIGLALKNRIIISDVWDYQDKGMMRVGVASVIDPEAPDAKPVGAVVVAYSQTAKEAQRQAAMFGAQVAYYKGTADKATDKATDNATDKNVRVFATSFMRTSVEEDTAKRAQLAGQLPSGGGGKIARITVDGAPYIVATAKIESAASRQLPEEFADQNFTAAVLAPLTDVSGISDIKKYIIFVGLGALAMAMLGLYLTHRRLISQIDQVELGVIDIINGNVDRTFRPVGLELDGLANGLNVMLARLLGRPEPGEEELDDDGNPIVQGRVEFEDPEAGRAAPDPELAALAQETEPDYYKRLYTEYLSARRGIGQHDEGSFENFIAKLKVNEGKLRAQYQCKVVRFRVVTKEGKVTLKPVPIFA